MDYIDRQAALGAMECIIDSICEQQAVDALIDLPAADVEPVRRGRWNTIAEQGAETVYSCSLCDCEAWGEIEKTPYCPYCGARMDGEL